MELQSYSVTKFNRINTKSKGRVPLSFGLIQLPNLIE